MSRRLWRNDRLHRSGGTLVRERNASFEITSSVGHSVWLVDASSASVTATLPSVDKMDKHIIHVVMREDAVTNGNVTVNDSGASEVWTGYAKGDYVTLTATNGTLYVLDERATAYGLLALTADESIAANSKVKIFDTGYSEEADNANWWNTTTDRLTVPFACLIELDFQIVCGSPNLSSSPKVNGTSLYDINGAVTAFDASTSTTGIYQLAASDYVEIEATNNNTTTAFSVLGDAAKDESQFRWNLIKRLRA